MSNPAIVTLLLSALYGPAASAAAGPPGLPFLDDLEQEDQECWSMRAPSGCNGWLSIRNAGISLAAGEPSFSGRKALKIVFAANEDYAGTVREVSSRHVFTRFYDYYAEGFDFAAGMKIHRLSSYDPVRQVNNFDIILYSQGAGGPDYCGPTDMQYLNMAYNGGPVDWGLVGGRLRMERGRWYSIETEVKLNTPGRQDGEIRIWVDGRLHAEKRGMDIAGKVEAPINRVMFGGWYSNSAAGKNPCPDPVRPSIRYLDDPAVSDRYIGTIPDIVLGPAPGSRILAWTMPEGGNASIEYGPTPKLGRRTAPEPMPQGRQSALITGLDTNRTYHYRIRSELRGGRIWHSPVYTFTTAEGGTRPPPGKRKDPPIRRVRHNDPIPD
jgi:hypothetical protein